MLNTLTRLDDDLFMTINHMARATPWLHTPLSDYAQYGIAAFAVLLVAAVWAARTAEDVHLARSGWACLAPLVAVAVNQPIVHAFAEHRPYATHSGILVLATRSTDPSFPSDHATMAGAVATALLIANRRLGVAAWTAAALMAFSRVYIAAHYPWDVVVGLALGSLVAATGWYGGRRLLLAATRTARGVRGVRAVFPRPPEGRAEQWSTVLSSAAERAW